MKINDLIHRTHTLCESTSVFHRSTGDSNIDAKIKNIIMMSPDEYLKQAYSATDERLGGSFEGWMASNERTKEDVVRYADAMKNGDVFPMPWIDYDAGSQDGRNRALAAKLLGMEEIPVGIIPQKEPDERIAEIVKELETAKGYKKFRLESELQRLRDEHDD